MRFVKREKEGGEGKRPPSEQAAPAGTARILRFLCATLLVLVIAFVVLVRIAFVAPSPGTELSLDEVYRLADQNLVKSVRFLDQHAVIVGDRCLAPPDGDARPRPTRCYDLTERFHSSYPASQVATQELLDVMRTSTGARVVVDPQTGIGVARLVVTFVLPLLLLANLFGLIFMARGGESSLSEVTGFGRFGRKRQNQGTDAPKVTFADVAGAEEPVTELREVIDYLTDPKRFEAYGAAPPKGVLLFGPPGCGKTLLARATAGESGVPFFSTAGTEFVESLVGVGAARVRDLFRQVREAAPAILFIDEIDAVGRRRSGEGTSGGEREQTLNQLLVELDGFEVSAGIVLMGATNRPDILDPALMRPGRFDRHVTMEPPDVTGRRAILELHARRRPIGPDVDFETLARRTPGFTGADLANVINEAALLAIRQGPGTLISAGLLSEAVLRVLHGAQRRGKLLSPEERHRLAVHESGHALVTTALGHESEVHRVSIVARGRALALSAVAGDEHALHTDSELGARLAMAMAGVAAEVLVFGGSSTTAEDDLSRATVLAREMIGLYGMSPALGRVRLLTRNEGYLGAEGPSLDVMSGPTMAEFDREVRRLVAEAEAKARELLAAHRQLLDEMAESLVHHETLEGPALAAFLGRVRQPPVAATTTPNGDGTGAQRPSRRAPRRTPLEGPGA